MQSRPPKPSPLPKLTAEQVLDGFVKNTGGAAAYARVTSASAQGTVQFVGQSAVGAVEIRSRVPDRFLMRLIFPERGEVALAYNGKEGWARDPNLGLRLLRGEELAQLRLQALQTNAPQSWRNYFKKVESLGLVQAGATRFYKLRLWPKDGGAPLMQLHDVSTLLLMRTDQVQESPQGKLNTVTYTSDWRLVEGIKTPFQIRQKTPDVELLLKLNKVQNNLPLPETDFARPAEAPSKPAKVK